MTVASSDLLLFDMDGVILDSAPAIVASVEAAFDENGLPIPDRKHIERNIGPPLRVMLRSLLRDSSDETLEACAESYRTHNDLYGASQTKIFPEAIAALSALSASASLRIATSKFEPSARNVIRALELNSFFQEVHGTVDPQHDSKRTVIKRAIDGHLSSHQGARIIAMIGDRSQDIDAAHQLGIHSIAVSWGYAIEDELSVAQPTYLVDDAEGLLSAVNTLRGS